MIIIQFLLAISNFFCNFAAKIGYVSDFGCKDTTNFANCKIFWRKNLQNAYFLTKKGVFMTKKERLEAIISHYSDGKPTVFAKYIGVAPSTISSWLSRDTFDYELLFAKCEEISPSWLLTGEGDMLKSKAAKHEGTTKELRRNYEAERRRIPLYNDIASIGGYNDQIADTETSAAHAAEWIDAGDWFPEATAAIRHYGDSMVEYPAGSILVLKRVQDRRLLINGRNYVIETTEFRITKQLQYDGGDYLMAYSSNPETYPDGRQIHSPIKIPLDTVRHIDLVLGCVQKEYSNGAIPIIQN